MSQLRMYKYMDAPCECEVSFNGFTYRSYNGSEADREAWVAICRHGELMEGEENAFERYITAANGYRPESVFFILDGEEPVATTTLLLQDGQLGVVHMVAVRPDYLGRGLGNYLNRIALAEASRIGCVGVRLTTDEWRVPAVKSYLKYGFRPVLYEEDMEGRWTAFFKEHGYTNMLVTDADFKAQKVINEDNTGKLRIGIFGAFRGSDIAHAATISNKAYITAVCDNNPERLEAIKKYCSVETQYFTDFDEFIEAPMDAVVLCNYFPEHAPYAIRAMKKGIHVASETLPAVTMQECVELCRTVEETGCIYMLLENYAYFPVVLRMKEEYDSGAWGKAVYTEGEYVHPMSPEEYAMFTPTPTHWRALMPSGYYLSHSLAPLMYITGATPTRVNARSIYTDAVRVEREGEPIKDVASIMLCGMDDNSLARVTGWAKFGGHGNWYRLSCAKACAETVRGNEFRAQVRSCVWEEPIRELDTPYPFEAEKARCFWHNGGDYYVTVDFIDCVKEKRQPYLNVYRAAAMAAVGILGWRSSLHDGAEYKIPDFSKEAERLPYENDTASPFLDENGERSYPCTVYEKDKFDI